MKLQLAYETSFKNMFGSRVSKHLNAIMQHATRFYKHTSLGTRITITPASHIGAGSVGEDPRGCGGRLSDVGLGWVDKYNLYFYYLKNKLLHSRAWQNKISRGEVRGLDTSVNHYALISSNRGRGVAGCAGPGACSRSASRRTSANVYSGDDLSTAVVSKGHYRM